MMEVYVVLESDDIGKSINRIFNNLTEANKHAEALNVSYNPHWVETWQVSEQTSDYYLAPELSDSIHISLGKSKPAYTKQNLAI